MAGTVSLGSMGTSGSTSRLFGSASGIDTEKLIGALSDAKRLPADRLEAKIDTNKAKIEAYGELRTRLTALRDAVAGLRNPSGTLGVRENVFEAKEVSFSSSTATSPASIVGVGAGNDVATGRFELVVEQLATARKLSGDAATSATADLADSMGSGAFSGSFRLGLAGGTDATIAVDGTMSLDDVRAAINAQSATSGVSASIVKVGASDHRLVLTATRTGAEVTLANGGADDVLAKLGLSADAGATFKNPLAAARPAIFSIDGIELTRDTNQITDAVPGMTLNLFKAEPQTTVTVEVERSLSGIRDAVTAFADAYNGVRDFVDEQRALNDDGKAAEGAVLFNDATLRSLTQALSETVARPVAGLTSGGPTNLAGIGLSLDPNNRLQVDGAKLETALLDDLDAVRDVLEFRFTSSSANLRVFDRGNGLTDTSFSLVVQDANGDGVAESATADGVALEVVGGRLIGPQGSAYAGLEMIWAGRGTETITVEATQGVADKLFNLLDETVDVDNGTLRKASDTLTDRNTDYAAEIERVDQRVERYREQLYLKFQAMETAMSLAQSMLEQVKAAFGGNQDD